MGVVVREWGVWNWDFGEILFIDNKRVLSSWDRKEDGILRGEEFKEWKGRGIVGIVYEDIEITKC